MFKHRLYDLWQLTFVVLLKTKLNQICFDANLLNERAAGQCFFMALLVEVQFSRSEFACIHCHFNRFNFFICQYSIQTTGFIFIAIIHVINIENNTVTWATKQLLLFSSVFFFFFLNRLLRFFFYLFYLCSFRFLLAFLIL